MSRRVKGKYFNNWPPMKFDIWSVDGDNGNEEYFFLFIDFYRHDPKYRNKIKLERIGLCEPPSSPKRLLGVFVSRAELCKPGKIKYNPEAVRKLPIPERNVLTRFIEKHNEEVPKWLKKEGRKI